MNFGLLSDCNFNVSLGGNADACCENYDSLKCLLQLLKRLLLSQEICFWRFEASSKHESGDCTLTKRQLLLDENVHIICSEE